MVVQQHAIPRRASLYHPSWYERAKTPLGDPLHGSDATMHHAAWYARTKTALRAFETATDAPMYYVAW